jgi:hypothetical protein
MSEKFSPLPANEYNQQKPIETKKVPAEAIQLHQIIFKLETALADSQLQRGNLEKQGLVGSSIENFKNTERDLQQELDKARAKLEKIINNLKS